MPDYWISIAVIVSVLTVSIPYVARIRHREQKPFAAYLIFISVFVLSGITLFSIFSWFVSVLFDMKVFPGDRWITFLVIFIVLLPAFIIATWQARKPPWRKGPPD